MLHILSAVRSLDLHNQSLRYIKLDYHSIEKEESCIGGLGVTLDWYLPYCHLPHTRQLDTQ